VTVEYRRIATDATAVKRRRRVRIEPRMWPRRRRRSRRSHEQGGRARAPVRTAVPPKVPRRRRRIRMRSRCAWSWIGMTGSVTNPRSSTSPPTTPRTTAMEHIPRNGTVRTFRCCGIRTRGQSRAGSSETPHGIARRTGRTGGPTRRPCTARSTSTSGRIGKPFAPIWHSAAGMVAASTQVIALVRATTTPGCTGSGPRDSQYAATSLVVVRIRLVPGSDPPQPFIVTAFPAGLL